MTETPAENPVQLWPEDQEKADGLAPGTLNISRPGPDLTLAIYLLGAGCTHSYVRTQAGFDSVRAVQLFAKDESTRQAVEALSQERVGRVGKKALVKLEKLLGEEHTDLRATVLAIRTGLEVSGDLKKDHGAPLKTVRELSVPELNRLIESTQKELEARLGSAEG